jgi:hypothetical protein
LAPFGLAVSEEKIFLTLANQKQELPLAAILVGSRDQRTQFWKGAIQESFQQSLVDIGLVVSEEKIFFFKPECAQI